MLGKTPFELSASGEWWTTRRFAVIAILLSLLPLLLPSMPPLVDLPGHIGRYRVQLDLDTSDYLRRYFDFHWAVIGNLGVDLLVEALAPLLGLEPAVKLVLLSIPATTVFGLLLIAREVHGRVPPTALFALPLAYCYPFQFGFVNFALAMAWALTAFGFWLRLARLGRLRLRAVLFVPVGGAIWLAHGFGWGVLGLLAFAAEIARARAAGRRIAPALFHAAVQCLPLVPPVLLMIVWRSDGSGQTADWFNPEAKIIWMASILREHWMSYDLASAVLLYAIALAGLTRFGIGRQPMLMLAAGLLGAAFLLLPRILFGSAYADMRLAPYVVAVALIALTPGTASARGMRLIAAAGLVFFLVRTAGTTAVFLSHDRAWQQQLEAIDHIPRGAPVYSLIAVPCPAWDSPRMDHIDSYAIARREAYVNGQWQMPGAQLLRVRDAVAPAGGADPTRIVYPDGCHPVGSYVYRDALARFPRAGFDYLWLIDVPALHWPRDRGLAPVWQGRNSALYRILHPSRPMAK